MATRAPKVPGDEEELEQRPSRASSDLLNNTSDSPNDVARARERQTQMMAVAATGGDGDYAQPPALDDTPAKRPASAVRERIIGGQKVRVHMPTIRRDDVVQQYGPESRLPKGTLVRKDGNPTEGDEEAYGVIGDIEIPGLGILVSRVIPFQDEEPEPKA